MTTNLTNLTKPEPSTQDVVEVLGFQMMLWRQTTDPALLQQQLTNCADALIRYFGAHYAKPAALPGLGSPLK